MTRWTLQDWQFQWRDWHFGAQRGPDWGHEFNELYLFIGPLQLRLWGVLK